MTETLTRPEPIKNFIKKKKKKNLRTILFCLLIILIGFLKPKGGLTFSWVRQWDELCRQSKSKAGWVSSCLTRWEEGRIVEEIIVNIIEQQIDSYSHSWNGKPGPGKVCFSLKNPLTATLGNVKLEREWWACESNIHTDKNEPQVSQKSSGILTVCFKYSTS